MKAMIASVDDDGNGTVEFEEFLVIMARRILMHEGAMELEAVHPPTLPRPRPPAPLTPSCHDKTRERDT